MTTHETLTVALVVALSSNAVLLLMLLLKSQNVNLFHDPNSATLEQNGRDIFPRLGGQAPNFVHHRVVLDKAHSQKRISDTSQSKTTASVSDTAFLDGDLRLRLLQNGLLQSGNLGTGTELDYLDVSSNIHAENDVKNQYPPISYIFKQYQKDVHPQGRDNAMGQLFRDIMLSAPSQTSITSFNMPQKTNVNEPAVDTKRLNLNEPLDFQSSNPAHQSHRAAKRTKREVKIPPKETVTDERSGHRIHSIFSTFTDGELAKFEPAVYDLLIPALAHFETMIIRELESFHSVIIAHDLRLENLEKFMLNIVNGNDLEPQADIVDNKSDPDSPSHILGQKEGFLPAENNSEILEVFLAVDGSGESEMRFTPTATSLQPTAAQNIAFYDFYRILSTVEQKVMALENYNVMSNSELTRVRSEVVKMDDKVTELDRRQRNLQIRTSMHTQKITDLEVYMSKSEVGIHTALDSYGRVNSRLEAFKDKLAEFRNDLQAVAAQFGRQDQISNELRAADSYKAHDIQEMRKSVFGIEGRLNGLYRVLDQNLDTVRSDLRVMLDRLCSNNKLAC